MRHQASLREIASGSLITLVGVGLHFFLQYVTLITVSRFWGATGLGLFVTGLTVLWLGGMSRLGLTGGTLRYVALLKGQRREGAIRPLLLSVGRITVVSSLLGGALLFMGADLIAEVVKKPALVPILRVMGVGLGLWNLVSIGTFAIQGLRKMKWLVWVRDIGQPGLALLAVAAAGILGTPFLGATVAYVVSLVPTLVFALVVLRRLLGPASEPDPGAELPLREVLFFSFPLIWTQLVAYGFRQQEILVLNYFVPAAQVGLYTAGLRTSMAVSFILNATNSIFAPVLAALHGTEQLDLLRRLYRTVARWGFTVAFPLYLICLLAGRQILSLWGPEFGAAYPVLAVLATAQLVNVSTGAAGHVLIMGARQKVELFNTVLASALGLALDILLIPKMGILGAAIAAGLSVTAVNLLRVIQTYRLWRANPFGASYLKPLGVGAVALGAAYLLGRWALEGLGLGSEASLGLRVILLVLLYVLGLWLAGFDADDREVARSLLVRIPVRRRRNALQSSSKMATLVGAPASGGSDAGIMEEPDGRN